MCKLRHLVACEMHATDDSARGLPGGSNRHAPCSDEVRHSPSEASMLDLIFVLATVAFFGLSWAYVRACDRL
jgi:hypothetical protein